jgi:hypothetical protein
MSFLVLHMNKFKKDDIRGIQSHNRRERKSRSNPDIDYGRSPNNYELHEKPNRDYAAAVQNRIDDLMLVKAVRKDAVHMCGLVVSSDAAFFKDFSPEETRKFFTVCKEYLTMFVGGENVVSAMVHLDEKTPHMHFLHVPATGDGRLNANGIYTRESLKNLQTGLPEYLRLHGFDIQRGVEQVPGSAKKHLDTREFKQQQNALENLRQETQAVRVALQEGKQRESVLRERVRSYEEQAQEAEKVLREESDIPDASVFTYKSALEKARLIIERQKKALAVKPVLEGQNRRLREELRELTARNQRLEAARTAEEQRGLKTIGRLLAENDKVRAELETVRKFARQPETHMLYVDFLQREWQQQAGKAAERQALEREEARRREEEKRQAQELERRRQEEERRMAREPERRGRGMGMSR